jgi:hypothetical protein
MLVISDGSSRVLAGTQTITFPTTVTDATLSPDGSRIAFVDGDGNIATARLDGTDVVALTKPITNGVRSRPAWRGWQIVFSEKVGNGSGQLRQVSATGSLAAQFTFNGITRNMELSILGAEAPPELGEAPDQDGSNRSTAGTAPSTAALAGRRGSDMAFQRDGANGSEVYLSDINARWPFYEKVSDGAEPALSADSSKVAFVKGGQIWVQQAFDEKVAPMQVTFDAKAPSHLVWSPDGAKLTFSTPSDVETVSATVSPGATSNPGTVAYQHPGVATYLGGSRDQLIRIDGSDPVASSIAASQTRWPANPDGQVQESDVFARQILITGTANAPLMLAGAQMVDYGPILITTGAGLDPRTAAEITRLFGKPHRDYQSITIVGDTHSVPSTVDAAIRKMGYAVSRVSATDPVAMAVKANGKPSQANVVLVVDSHDTAAYASAISDLGAYSQQTVLLTDGTKLPAQVRGFLNSLPSKVPVYGLGQAAQSALTSWSSKRWKPMGTDAASATTQLLGAFGGRTDTLVVTASANSGDVLAAIGLARAYGAPILAVGADGIDKDVASWIGKASGQISRIIVIDSNASVHDDVLKTVTDAVCGPFGPTTATNPEATA